MSSNQITLCSHILEHFGERVEQVAVYLLKKGWMPLKEISINSSFNANEVKKCLQVLLQHGLVNYRTPERGSIEYGADVERILVWNRFPCYQYNAKTLYGDVGEMLIEELLHHGQLETHDLLEKVVQRLTENESENISLDSQQVREKFENLLNTQFIERSPTKDSAKMVNWEEMKFKMPSIDMEGIVRRKGDDESVPKAKRRRLDTKGNVANDSVAFWRVNFDRFHRHMRDQKIIWFISYHYGNIFQALPRELGLSRRAMDELLSELCDRDRDMLCILSRVDESRGGMFSINFKKFLETLTMFSVESIILENFGRKSADIFFFVLKKKRVEEDSVIRELQMPAKEAGKLLFKLVSEGFLAMNEISRGTDHTATNAFFIFSVNAQRVANNCLQSCYANITKLTERRDHEYKENKRLVEKQLRMEAIAATLEQSGADEAQKQELQEMITAAERQQLVKFNSQIKQLDLGEIQLDELCLLLTQFLKSVCKYQEIPAS